MTTRVIRSRKDGAVLTVEPSPNGLAAITVEDPAPFGFNPDTAIIELDRGQVQELRDHLTRMLGVRCTRRH